MNKILIGIAAASALVATLAWAGVHPSDGTGECLTRADVQHHFERSFSGISLTCNDEIRARNLARKRSR